MGSHKIGEWRRRVSRTLRAATTEPDRATVGAAFLALPIRAPLANDHRKTTKTWRVRVHYPPENQAPSCEKYVSRYMHLYFSPVFLYFYEILDNRARHMAI